MDNVVVNIDGTSLSIESLIAIRDNRAEVRLTDEARISMANSRKAVESIIESEKVVYGDRKSVV